MKMLKALLVAATIAGGFGTAAALAATFRFADQGDALSMDPQALNESLQLSIMGSVYEPLVGRGKKLELVPILATSWKQTSPTVWRFVLRKDVKFHDGTPFTADDVIFSYERAKAESSDMKTYVAPIKEIKKIDDLTIDVVTSDPFPILRSGRRAQGQGERRHAQGQWDGAVHAQVAGTWRTYHLRAQSQLLDQGREQHYGGGVHADR